jgi:hypothetical protein
VRKIIATLTVIGGLILISASSCEEGQPSSAEREAESRSGSYDAQVEAQPGATMGYSPTRATINRWIETWNEPDKLAYVYLQAANGQLLGYFVFRGPPVSMCAALSPTYDLIEADLGDYHGDMLVPAPGVDGAYYSGGQCNTEYGIDATTDTVIQYTIGSGINSIVYQEPLARADVEPLGTTTVEDVD